MIGSPLIQIDLHEATKVFCSMNRSEYQKAFDLLEKHYQAVLDDFTERMVAAEEDEYSTYSSFGSSRDDMIHEFARKLESIIICGDT